MPAIVLRASRLAHRHVYHWADHLCANVLNPKENIQAKIGLILSFSLILIWGARLPIVRIGRVAGQYAKPRSSSTEIINGKEVLSFRGDNVNELSSGCGSLSALYVGRKIHTRLVFLPKIGRRTQSDSYRPIFTLPPRLTIFGRCWPLALLRSATRETGPSPTCVVRR